jgi:formylglycine-generating enzyme required for sulfatase activity
MLDDAKQRARRGHDRCQVLALFDRQFSVACPFRRNDDRVHGDPKFVADSDSNEQNKGMTDCGAGGSGAESCCTSIEVPGGTFERSFDDVTYTDNTYQASVSKFRLDKYEITVGRFRQFVSAVVGGWLPVTGAGKHSHVNGGSGLAAAPNVDAGQTYEAGWDATDWNSLLATTSSVWTTNLSCDQTYETWTASLSGGNESKPINCETWYEAYAFCIWDGGLLPSEAEWNYAAAGGGGSGGQDAYPWSSPSTSTTLDCAHANYGGSNPPSTACVAAGANNVGAESPKGDGAFGQTDLAGNVWEWNLDWYAMPYVNPCADCADLAPASNRVFRGGAFSSGAAGLLVSNRNVGAPSTTRGYTFGARCARTP